MREFLFTPPEGIEASGIKIGDKYSRIEGHLNREYIAAQIQNGQSVLFRAVISDSEHTIRCNAFLIQKALNKK